MLEGMSADVRTPDKLLDGVCESDEWSHMWLSPILPGCVRYTLKHFYYCGRGNMREGGDFRGVLLPMKIRS